MVLVAPIDPKEGKKASSDGFRVAQVDQGKAASDTSVEKQAEQASRKTLVQLEEVIVTGSRIPEVAGQRVQPVRSYTREDIERSGQTTVFDFLSNLPDVSGGIIGETFIGYSFQGKTTVQIHGLPVGTTLLLLNGQRLEVGSVGFFDLSNLPASVIERVEVLPVGASAVYGADALGGAINIILRKNLNGFEANTTFNHIAGANDTSTNIAWGKSWQRGSLLLLGSYQARDELLGNQRPQTSSTQFPADAPTFFYFVDDCSPGNVYSLNGQNLPGLSSSQAGIPPGISGTPTVQQFTATAGHLNQCNVYRNSSLNPATQRAGALLSGHYQLTESMDLFSEILFSHERVRATFAFPPIDKSHATLGANNPYNPFGEAVGVSFDYAGIRSRWDEAGSLIRPLIGVRGSLFSDWRYEATAYFSHDGFEATRPGNVNSSAFQTALNSSDPNAALNPFAAGAPGTPQLLQSLVSSAASNRPSRFINQIVDGQGFLRGTALHLPAGVVEAVVGGEYSRLKEITETGLTLNLHRDAYAVFTEARVPLLANPQGAKFGEQLALTVAGRYDHNSDFGGKATWQGGLLWRPVETLSLSASYGVSYRAPRLDEISPVPGNIFDSNNAFLGTDPLRGGEAAMGTNVFGANPNLGPETGNSRTLSIVYSSQTLHGFEASLSHFAVNITNYIGIPNSQDIINNPNLYPGAVVRAPATPQDQQRGFPGRIIQINDLYYNFGDLKVAGFDADVAYVIETGVGQFKPSLAITNIYKWQSALIPGSPLVGYVNKPDGTPGWAPRWKGTVALSWTRRALSANISGRYIGRYQDYQYIPNSNQLGNAWIIDTNIRFEAGHALAGANRWLSGTYVAVGAVNLFDKSPRFSYGGVPWDYSSYDLRGRMLYAQAGVKW